MHTAERELIHRELDGENSPDESRRLQALIADNGEARKLFEELSAVDSRLRESEMVEPPPWLKRSVMDALPEQRRSTSTGLSAFLGNLREMMQARPALAYAYTFVIGLAAGLALFAVALQNAPEGELYGTLVDREALERLSAVEATPIQLPGFSGEIELLTSRELLAIDVIVEAQQQTEVRLATEPSLKLRGFTRRSGDGSVDVQDNTIVLTVDGPQQVALLFDRRTEEPSEVRLEVRREGRLIHEERLRAD